ncbi:MAG: hypothetical protein IKK75_02110 [Clostridia bacterium]|nr:hypothetical protein [Clostridia bacterium]
MKKQLWKKRLREAAVWVLAALWVEIPVVLGIVFRAYVSWPLAWCIGSVCLLVLLCTGSLIADGFFRKWLRSASVQNAQDEILRRQQRMRDDEQREKRRLERICLLISLYIVLLAALVFAACFFCGAVGKNMVILPIACVFLMYGLVDGLFALRQGRADLSGALSPEKYPRLYALAREAAELDQDAPLYIYPGDYLQDEECNAGVGQQGSAILLALGPVMLCVVTEGELKQIIRHEMAHINQADVRESKRYYRLMDYLAGGEGNRIMKAPASFVLRFPAEYLLFEGKNYLRLSSLAKESRADQRAADEGDHFAQASALAKMQAYGFFQFEQENRTNLFRDEKLPQDMVTRLVRQFRGQLKEREKDWRRMLYNELPSRSATHPTFPQRLEALGNCAYSLEPAPETGDFASECWAVAAEADRRMMEIGQDGYDKMRKEGYLDHLEVAEAYEADPSGLDLEDIRALVLAYYRLGRLEEAEQICDMQLAAIDNPFVTAFARYWKGVIMLHRYDNAGLDYLYQAMDTNRNYIEESLPLIGRYCTMMGLEKELEDYRSRAVDYMQENEDYDSIGITSKANLSSETLPEGWQEKILSFILKTAQGGVTHVYLVHETVSEDYAPSSFVLRYREGLSDEEIERIYTDVFRLLDDWPEGWEFCLYDYEPSMFKPLSKVEGSCIYAEGE